MEKLEAYEVLVDSIQILLNKNGFMPKNNDVINDLIDKVIESVYVELLEEEKQEESKNV